MTITMQNVERLTLAEMQGFFEGSRTVGFAGQGREAVYGFIQRVLVAQRYRRLSKGQKGIVRRFLAKMTGLSRPQMTRLV
ncbi:MAG: integrase, partial [Gammaproteobacteria bacterium]